LTGIKDWTINGTYTVLADGKLTIHGVSKPVKQNGQVTIENGKIIVSATFTVQLLIIRSPYRATMSARSATPLS
jgi:polyisoprenoid-binding protein YceI